MKKITTPHFTLAVYQQGNEHAERLALVLPGRLDTKDYPHMKSHVDFLATQGFLALSFDPPGTWESAGNIEDYTMTNYLKVITELIDYFENKPTLLMGHSRGGSMAMLGAITIPDVSHVIAVMSSTSPSKPYHKMEPGDSQEEFRDIPGTPDQKKKFVLPYTFFEDAGRYDLLGGLKDCSKPKLFIFGTHDKVVDPQEVRQAFASAAEPKKLQELNSGHDYRRHPDMIEQVNVLVKDFLVK